MRAKLKKSFLFSCNVSGIGGMTTGMIFNYALAPPLWSGLVLRLADGLDGSDGLTF